ncbi:hypothetical protein GCM10023149_27780 [Mucilaginibacter gynuensis]|uniref:Uncharacterized protein n=1 Tax=Mucilaginibacter gynuensis TaxID=1302236 RepID=A0ABP8GJW6_9SPHI
MKITNSHLNECDNHLNETGARSHAANQQRYLTLAHDPNEHDDDDDSYGL